MTEGPLVSVVIIFFNAEKYLREAIESVLRQSYERWELLLVDDGSTDGSAQIASFHADMDPARMRILLHPNGENRGMCASRNLGIRHASGKYLAFLDADDVWLPQKLEEQVALLESQPRAGMLYGKTEYWHSWNPNPGERNRDFVPDLGVPPNEIIAPPALVPLFLRGKASVPCTCSILVKRSVVSEVGGFDESFTGLYSIYEDQAFYSKVCLATPVLAADRCWDRYRQHSESSVAVAAQAGLSARARRFFLEWLQDFLTNRQVEDSAVWLALRREMWLLKHPAWLCGNTPARTAWRRIKKWVLRIEENALPAFAERRIWLKRDAIARAQNSEPLPAVRAVPLNPPRPEASGEEMTIPSGSDPMAESLRPIAQKAPDTADSGAQESGPASHAFQAPSATRAAIIILSLNQRDVTLQCLASLQRSNSLTHQTLLWDNGSADGTSAAVRQAFPEVFVHEHPVNLGVASGRNAAASLTIEEFQPSHLLFLDNDMIVQEGFVEALLAPFRAEPKIAQTQAKLRLMDDRKRLNDGGGARISFIRCQAAQIGFGEIDRGQYDRSRECIAFGGSTMVRTEVFQELGGFDPQFDPFGPEDIDFSLRLRKAGYRALFVPDAVAYHRISHTIGKGYSSLYARLKSRHWLQLMRRHATRRQQAGFVLFGMPYLAICVILREGRRGNFSALAGLFCGVLDFVAPSLRWRERS
ncbi:MAG TPA: glycosyltransferase [Acidobacteriota bacterium]|nr:glycosyltransferase [Acidobacteriota bacterium]